MIKDYKRDSKRVKLFSLISGKIMKRLVEMRNSSSIKLDTAHQRVIIIPLAKRWFKVVVECRHSIITTLDIL